MASTSAVRGPSPTVDLSASVVLSPAANIYETAYVGNKAQHDENYPKFKAARHSMLVKNADWLDSCAIHKLHPETLVSLSQEDRLKQSNDISSAIKKMERAKESAFTHLEELDKAITFIGNKNPDWLKELTLMRSRVTILYTAMEKRLPIAKVQGEALSALLMPPPPGPGLMGTISSMLPSIPSFSWGSSSAPSSAAITPVLAPASSSSPAAETSLASPSGSSSGAALSQGGAAATTHEEQQDEFPPLVAVTLISREVNKPSFASVLSGGTTTNNKPTPPTPSNPRTSSQHPVSLLAQVFTN